MGKSASKQFNDEVLKAHNEYRKQHGVAALKLCKKLNREAQQYSEALASTRILKHSPESSRGQCGENLAWASYDQTGKEVADRWYSEIKNYNFQQPGFTSGTGLLLLWPLPLRSTGSGRAGSVVMAHGPSCSAACGIFPDRGTNPCPLHQQADSQPLRHQGSPNNTFI
ncbi:Golgi-associated plant pathogenesis-related protein 1 isoform X1 [Kogia breviceps]|uniref:Golgi-associated plant pathogenesis-related protein 1 isoform X1 n=1 Tax=Kogia breviceps TaxID=27615 RepID=UPI0034D1F731